VKLAIVSGIQGSGKTTLIREMVTRFVSQGKTCGVIVNEEGEAKYDDSFVSSENLKVETLRGG
jgi:G3E family GTPase